MAKQAAAQDDDELEDNQVCDAMAHAREVAEEVFGSALTTSAIHTIYDYLLNSEDADLFLVDLKRVARLAGVSHKTDTPTPDEVFGFFVRRFPEED